MFGSGQWTIWEGYAASKLFKAGFRTNNLDPNARHCMASAVAGFMRTFGIDEPMGCYDDIEAADAFVLWGSNMAEMHPILWTRVTDRRLSAPHVQVAVLSTFEHRSFELADIGIIFTPQTDLAILNYIANHIIKTGRVNKDFVDKHTVVQARARPTSATACGPSTRCRRRRRAPPRPNDSSRHDASTSSRSSSPTTRSRRRRSCPACRANRLEALAELYADPKIKVMSLLDHGLQPAHPRRLVQQPRLQHPSADRQDLRRPATARSR